MLASKKFYLFIIAAVFSAAIFLLGENPLVVSYVNGKVDLINIHKKGTDALDDLEVNASILSHNVITTGKGSRTEIIQDSNIWRLGSQSVCRWFSSTDFWLHSGSALFCTKEPTKINFSSFDSNATFEGKGTIIIEATKNGGFKFIPVEADGRISTVAGGDHETLGGRMLLVIGNPTYFGNAFDIDLMLLLKSSRLINAYPSILPSFDQIGLSVYVQELKMKGKYDALIGDATTNENLQMWKFGPKPDGRKSKRENSPSVSPKRSFLRRILGSK